MFDINVDYRDILIDDLFTLTSEVVGLHGVDVCLLLKHLDRYSNPFQLHWGMFIEDDRYEKVVFDDLTKFVYEARSNNYWYDMTLYSYRGVIFGGDLVCLYKRGDSDDDDIVGFEEGSDLIVPVMKYIYDGVRHLI